MSLSPKAVNKALKGLYQLEAPNEILEEFATMGIPNEYRLEVDHVPKYDDRSAVIIYGSITERSLEDAVSRHFVISPETTSDYFSYDSGFLGSFKSKINLGYAMGVFGKSMHHDLTWISRIRNAFAHTRTKINFQEQSISDACNLLIMPSGKHASNPVTRLEHCPSSRDKYVLTACFINEFLMKTMRNQHRVAPYQDNPEYCHFYDDP